MNRLYTYILNTIEYDIPPFQLVTPIAARRPLLLPGAIPREGAAGNPPYGVWAGRVLSNGLRELEKGGMIERIEQRKGPNFTRWALTEKGNDMIPILMRFAAFGSKSDAEDVFEDKTTRRLRQVYPAWEAQSVEKRYP